MSNADSGVEFSMTRMFDAPRAQVFATMTEAEHLRQWWGPQGCSIAVIKHDLQPGGIFHYCMSFAPGVEMCGKFTYQEITPVERVVFHNGFADADGNYIHYAMVPDWPLEVSNTLTLEDQGGQTMMRLTSLPVGASDTEINTFKAGHASMEQGFSGMYDVYASYLASLK